MIAQIFFGAMAALAVFGALATILAKNPIRGALGLLVMILSVAGLFLALHAEFLAVIQLIVYAGAIVILFLFIMMILGPSATPPHDQRGRVWRYLAGAVFLLVSAGALWAVVRAAPVVAANGMVVSSGARSANLALAPSGFGGVEAIGRSLFTSHLVPFELSSALLMVAVIGAVAVAKGKTKKADATDTAPAASSPALEGT